MNYYNGNNYLVSVSWNCVVNDYLLNVFWSVCGSDNDDDDGDDDYDVYVYNLCVLNEAAYNTLILRGFAFSSSDVPNNQ